MISRVGAKDMQSVFILILTVSEKENAKTNHECSWMGLNKVPHVEEWALGPQISQLFPYCVLLIQDQYI